MSLTSLRSFALTAAVLVAAAPGAGVAAPHTVDVLGVYPNHVADRLADPTAAFVSHIEYANRALQNSGANYRYNLVHVRQINWPQDDSMGSSQLESLAQNAAIQALREQYGADLVAGMVPSSSGICGYGYLAPADSQTHQVRSYASDYGYSLSGHDCGGRTMAHEMGHNMGLGHSPAQGSQGTVAHWGRGWGKSGEFVTIMAYSSAYNVFSSAGRLQLHSNPAMNTCNGNRCGQPRNQTDGADATRALNLASPQISQWLDSTVGNPPNEPPLAADDNATTDAGKAVRINVLDNDSDPDGDALTVASVGKPQNGTAKIDTGAKTLTYSPADGYSGTDRFNYTLKDARGATDRAAVQVKVNPVPTDPPTDNLVVNGDGESGTTGWTATAGADVKSSTRARRGKASIGVRAEPGERAKVKLKTPIPGNRFYKVSVSVRASNSNQFYIYLVAQQNGKWRSRYVAARRLRPDRWVDIEVERYLRGSHVDNARLHFYFPDGTGGTRMHIDELRMELQ